MKVVAEVLQAAKGRLNIRRASWVQGVERCRSTPTFYLLLKAMLTNSFIGIFHWSVRDEDESLSRGDTTTLLAPLLRISEPNISYVSRSDLWQWHSSPDAK